MAWNYDCTNHFARFRRSVWSIPRSASGAQQRFEQADWHAVQQAMKTVSIFTIITWVWWWSNCAAYQRPKHGRGIFTARQRALHRLLPDYPRFEIAESFFNSVYVGYLTTARLLPSGFLSLAPSRAPFSYHSPPAGERLSPRSRWESLLMRVISDLPLRLRWQIKAVTFITSFAI